MVSTVQSLKLVRMVCWMMSSVLHPQKHCEFEESLIVKSRSPASCEPQSSYVYKVNTAEGYIVGPKIR